MKRILTNALFNTSNGLLPARRREKKHASIVNFKDQRSSGQCR